ncbi:MAG: circularly permuted type 2 ATP-grasp protein [Rhizobiales bacterium]|nr:circularly permuted type 2 ATP-grasp protein [Hyphomicrobiales bacterium]
MPLPRSSTHDNRLDRLLKGYRPLDSVPDELIDGNGAVRPVWTSLLQSIAGMSEEEISLRIGRGKQYLSDAGVYYRQYNAAGTSEREWPLSPLPVLIDEDEWQEITAGLIQRADLLEKVVADLYGDNTLVAKGHLPASLISNNREWLRPLVGIKPRSGSFLHFIAMDIGRGPGGEWWVLGDRTQAPSGAGFALENRIATARIYSELFGRSNVHRLAGFFRHFRDSLMDLRNGDESRVGILTPGPMNDTYFEHAYIARYLGFVLLEGEDMTMRNGQLMVRTVDGLRPISVLWRRLDSFWADPLELHEKSRIGTAGMLEAVREGNLTMVNALGSGILETRALLAFLPRISQALLREELRMPNIATWWCGQPTECDFVKKNAHRMTIGNAYATRFLFDHDDISAVGGTFNQSVSESLSNWIDQNGDHLVGQESVHLSTTPSLEDGVIVPRPMSLRVFLARTSDGWTVMPGGFARIGRTGNSAALAVQNGGTAADVWIVSKAPVRNETMLLDPTATQFVRQKPGVLPSRAADNLFWLGRYVERSETIIRLLRAYHLRLAEADSGGTPLLRAIAAHLDRVGVVVDEKGLPAAVIDNLAAAVAAAAHIRDRFSMDGTVALNDISKTVRQMKNTVAAGDDMARAMSVLLRKLSGFSGLVHENMYRFTGWRFLNIGRAIERAASLTSLLASFADSAAPEGSLDFAIEIADSAMSHRRRYAVSTNRSTVVDLLGLDPLNPRSVMYQLREISDHVSYLPGTETHRQLQPFQRTLLQSETNLAMMVPEKLTTRALIKLGLRLGRLSDELTTAYMR